MFAHGFRCVCFNQSLLTLSSAWAVTAPSQTAGLTASFAHSDSTEIYLRAVVNSERV